MKKSDLKQLIKPLVKECIHEVLLEEGLLSNVVSEVAKGMQGNLLAESASTPQPAPQKKKDNTEARRKLMEHRKKLLSSINADAYNGVDLFEGTTPMQESKSGGPGGALSGVAPDDAGIDISGILNIGGDKWSKLI